MRGKTRHRYGGASARITILAGCGDASREEIAPADLICPALLMK